jgi:hypothetical protein
MTSLRKSVFELCVQLGGLELSRVTGTTHSQNLFQARKVEDDRMRCRSFKYELHMLSGSACLYQSPNSSRTPGKCLRDPT